MAEEQEQEFSQDQLDQAESAAFQAAIRGEEPADGTTKSEDETVLQPEEPVVTTETVVEVEEEKPVLAGLTESQIRAKLDRLETLEGTSQKLSGQIGAMKEMIHQLKSAQKQQLQQQPPQVVAKLERLRAQGYDEFANSLEEDLKGFVSQTNQVDPKKIEEQVEERVSKAVSDFATKFFESQHPDWRESVASKEYDAWRETLTPEEFQETETSHDLFYAAKKLSEFKSWREGHRKQQEKQQGEAQVAERLKQEQKRRLAAAAQPSGLAPVTQSALSEEEAFMQARRSKPSLRSAN